MKWKSIGVILISISLLGLAGIVITTGIAQFDNTNVLNTGEQTLGMSPAANVDWLGIQTTGLQTMTGSAASGLKFSGKVMTCSNITDVGQVIDLRLSNLDVNNQSISIYPLAKTIDLLPKQIKRIDLPLPYGVTTLELVSSNGEKLIIGVPTCVSDGYSSIGSQIGFSNSTEQSNHPPPPIPELSTNVLIGLGIFGLAFIIGRRNE
jgi:hypothetical protein